MASQIGAGAGAPIGRPLFGDSPDPSWPTLRSEAIATPTGESMEENKRLWEEGAGPPHTDAKLRLFGSTGEPRVIFYRDTAAWCPYCQKVWMMLEEKQIPYKIEKINMRSYGEKPSWYLQIVPSGLLPAISLDGQLITESLVIMQTLEAAFPEPRRMLPDRDTPVFEEAVRLLNLERELFRWWCQFVFRSGESSRGALEKTLDEVNSSLASSPGPWFLPSSASAEEAANGSPDDGFSLVDLTYVPHLERMAASTAYWKGLQLRGNPRWASINRWFEALEMRETYMATKSDFYTHVQDIPPQHEAAYKLTGNAEAVARFACRGAGRGSGWSMLPGRAPLSDPNASPNLHILPDVDYCLRRIASAMMKGSLEEDQAVLTSGAVSSGQDPGTVAAVEASLVYLRDRIGVPRDMSYPAARQFRAHLNWAIDILKN
nr:glutathione S-transferase [Saccharina japonica]